MDNLRAQVECRIIGEQLSDLCRHKEGIIFNPALCTQERCIRFTSPLMQEIFPSSGTKTGAWKSGCFFMYEIYNGIDEFRLTASVSLTGLVKKQRTDCLRLLESCGVKEEPGRGLYFLREWTYPGAARRYEKILPAVTDFFEYEMPYFETELRKWQGDHGYRIKPFPDVTQVSLPREELPEELLIEGGMKDILTNRYERNPEARWKCIAVHGSACNICGFDFGAVYGAEFAGKIEVHHIVPLHEIREDYIVDPVNDLIPVCPNCHMILHSKPGGGTYTPDEVRQMIGKKP